MKKMAIPPMLEVFIHNALCEMEGIEFAHLEACETCGGEVKGHDFKRKRFASVKEGNHTRDIHVLVKRFRCTRCGRLCYAESPFYPDTRLGAPIVDLCSVLCREMPYHRAAQVMEALGIVVDRGTIRNYAARDFGPIPYTKILGIPLPLSLLHLSTAALALDKRASVVGAEALFAFRPPPALRAALGTAPPRQQGNQRDKE